MSRRLPRGVVALGLVSLCMDVSSEMIHSLLPVFLVGVMGVSALVLGVIEGVAESVVSLVKLYSGALSDRLGKRKPLLVAGYGLAAATKPLFALAQGAGVVFAARLLDRTGKGIRGAPRDALIADLVPAAQRGAAYGLRQSMDSAGAVLGPLLALALMAAYAGDIRAVFWWAVLPALLAVLLIFVAVPEAPPSAARKPRHVPLRRRDLARLGAAFWGVAALGTFLMLARFSEAFVLLRGESAGLTASTVPLVLLVLSAAYALSAWPLGILADRVPRPLLIAAGLALLVGAQVALAFATSRLPLFAGCVLWGLHMGATQGLLSAMVADACPDDLRGTGFGMFGLLQAGATLLASVLAGALWHAYGPAATFAAGAGFALLALLLYPVISNRLAARTRNEESR